jgi:hypothetical protein
MTPCCGSDEWQAGIGVEEVGKVCPDLVSARDTAICMNHLFLLA